MKDEVLIQARKAVDDILNALGVARVVYVDDTNDESVALEDVIAAVPGLAESQLLALFPELGDALPDDPDVLAQNVRSLWGEIDPNRREERGQAVLIAARRQEGDNSSDGENTDDIADTSIMSNLVAEAK